MRKATERPENASPADHTLPRLSEFKHTERRIPNPQRRGGPCHCSRAWVLQTTIECLFSYYNILYSQSVSQILMSPAKKMQPVQRWTDGTS